MKAISVIIPVYNEEKVIQKTLLNIVAYTSKTAIIKEISVADVELLYLAKKMGREWKI